MAVRFRPDAIMIALTSNYPTQTGTAVPKHKKVQETNTMASKIQTNPLDVYNPRQYGTTFGAADYDYITLTTFQKEPFYSLWNLMADECEPLTDRFRGYSGKRFGAVRLLEGDQQGRWHGIAIAEGSSASWMVEAMSKELCDCHELPLYHHFRCTRLDVQLSVPDDSLDFRNLLDTLSSPTAKWRRRGRAPKMTLIQGEKTNRGLGCTLYIGSSKVKNGYFVRVYEKENSGKRHIRYEVQYKGKTADMHFGSAVLDLSQELKSAMVSCVLETTPLEAVEGPLQPVRDALDKPMRITVREKVVTPDDQKRCLWFKYNVAPTLMKIDDDHCVDWLKKELLKVILVLSNRQKRRKIIAQWEDDASSMEDLDYYIATDHRIAQIDATESLVLQSIKDGKGTLGASQLPVQDSLFSVDELKELVDVMYESPALEYR